VEDTDEHTQFRLALQFVSCGRVVDKYRKAIDLGSDPFAGGLARKQLDGHVYLAGLYVSVNMEGAITAVGIVMPRAGCSVREREVKFKIG